MKIQPSQIRLQQTCGACPEQYDAFYGDRQVGYLRLRWGTFSVQYPNAGGEEIHVAEWDDKFMGMFPHEERGKQLEEARIAIARRLNDEEQLGHNK